MKYRKKPIEIEAIKWDGRDETADEIVDMVPGATGHISFNDQYVYIDTPEGEMTAGIGDWIIKEPFATRALQLYPCKPDIFEQTYEKVQ